MCVDTSSEIQCPELDVLAKMDKINLDLFLTSLLLFCTEETVFEKHDFQDNCAPPKFELVKGK